MEYGQEAASPATAAAATNVEETPPPIVATAPQVGNPNGTPREAKPPVRCVCGRFHGSWLRKRASVRALPVGLMARGNSNNGLRPYLNLEAEKFFAIIAFQEI